jgi:hypothetical protein
MQSAGDDLNYLKPPAAAYQIVHTDHYKKHGEGKKAIRKIFYSAEFDQFERDHIKELEDALNKEHVVLPSWWTREETCRFCYCQRFDVKKCVDVVKQHIEWRVNPLWQTVDHDSRRYIEDGTFYQFGRDKGFRPIVIINVHKVDLKKGNLDGYMRALCYLFVCVEKYMFLKGKVENWTVMIETDNMGLFSFPYKILQSIISLTQINFTSRMEKLFLLNPSWSLDKAWKMISAMMDPETSQKINFLQKKAFNKLLDQIPVDQLEVKYGGTAPNVTHFWPPTYSMKEPAYVPPEVEPAHPVQVESTIVVSKPPLVHPSVAQNAQANTHGQLAVSEIKYHPQPVNSSLQSSQLSPFNNSKLLGADSSAPNSALGPKAEVTGVRQNSAKKSSLLPNRPVSQSSMTKVTAASEKENLVPQANKGGVYKQLVEERDAHSPDKHFQYTLKTEEGQLNKSQDSKVTPTFNTVSQARNTFFSDEKSRVHENEVIVTEDAGFSGGRLAVSGKVANVHSAMNDNNIKVQEGFTFESPHRQEQLIMENTNTLSDRKEEENGMSGLQSNIDNKRFAKNKFAGAPEETKFEGGTQPMRLCGMCRSEPIQDKQPQQKQCNIF